VVMEHLHLSSACIMSIFEAMIGRLIRSKAVAFGFKLLDNSGQRWERRI
jgi:hypothetical protein